MRHRNRSSSTVKSVSAEDSSLTIIRAGACRSWCRARMLRSSDHSRSTSIQNLSILMLPIHLSRAKLTNESHKAGHSTPRAVAEVLNAIG